MSRILNGKNSVLIIIVLLIAIGVFYSLLFVNFDFIGKKSIQEDARAYKTRHCLAFYPNSSDGLKNAKEVCKGVKDDSVFDYTLIPYGDYYLINYGGDFRYFTDKNYKTIKVEGISEKGETIILDYLRYTYKKDYPEKYYNSKFLKSLNIESIDFDSIAYDIDGTDLLCYVPAHDMTLRIPLKYVQKEIGMDFGFPYEIYTKPVYISDINEHPVIALTFDDGPKIWTDEDYTSTEHIIDLLYEYDAAGTFYVIGNTMQDREIWADYQVYTMLKKSINHGNEYGSHTQSHLQVLTALSSDEAIFKEINGPIEYMEDFMEYDIKTYRPVEGVFSEHISDISPVGAVLWNVDSEDWMSDTSDEIYNQVMKYDYESGDVILFHDIYNITAEALERIIPEMIDKGYQLVNVSSMLYALDIDESVMKYYYGANYYG